MLLECLEGVTQILQEQVLEKPSIGRICEMKGRLEKTLSDRRFSLNQNQGLTEPVQGRCL